MGAMLRRLTKCQSPAKPSIKYLDYTTLCRNGIVLNSPPSLMPAFGRWNASSAALYSAPTARRRLSCYKWGGSVNWCEFKTQPLRKLDRKPEISRECCCWNPLPIERSFLPRQATSQQPHVTQHNCRLKYSRANINLRRKKYNEVINHYSLQNQRKNRAIGLKIGARPCYMHFGNFAQFSAKSEDWKT